jgi:hypothetical protein
MHVHLQAIAERVLLSTVLLLTAAVPIGAQAVHGKLSAGKTDAPINGAAIALVTDDTSATPEIVTTDGTGAFVLSVPGPGIYRVRVAAPGQPAALSPEVELAAGDDINLGVRLAADSVFLRPVSVTTKNKSTKRSLTGFAERAKAHTFGNFITRDEIEKRKPLFVSDLLATVPGLQVVPSPRGVGNEVLTTTGCRPAVYLDGLRYPLRGESIDHIVNPMDIEGIEVYSNPAEVPVEYQGPGSSCGAIVIWTRT